MCFTEAGTTFSNKDVAETQRTRKEKIDVFPRRTDTFQKAPYVLPKREARRKQRDAQDTKLDEMKQQVEARTRFARPVLSGSASLSVEAFAPPAAGDVSGDTDQGRPFAARGWRSSASDAHVEARGPRHLYFSTCR